MAISNKTAEAMKCSKCGHEIGDLGELPEYRQVFQVRVGSLEEDKVTFLPDEDVGYYCSACLAAGV